MTSHVSRHLDPDKPLPTRACRCHVLRRAKPQEPTGMLVSQEPVDHPPELQAGAPPGQRRKPIARSASAARQATLGTEQLQRASSLAATCKQ